ncbi:hypothetical protein HRR83_005054 [Exophiala dermatitidis]|uniref:Uncharacterized protein n=2 Tax=Exophiala dermatitidis TaxID=5970 RepID=H6C372_EXODN|nr:uncharacterized protein HMPREF1120_06105 [Exophiala dermatitidis NIH/UT8656]KAJ4513793.1 hypothetical protein HRR75_004374 [Exophiala dermatitidis]EHY58087.1 hypothetical protein HMPREF1120_06105 [Exophiala dermatitidis NIH/UT8656]KAJ4517032.1 hypothetical protein HRR74_004782 [Exophiala dermatitidis]KAJ4519790.1 hypothetical protein HRR73_003850 [Exophiala dermatitidis]KAJ4534407.1 hypothetical protein HRR76_006332 [Exophiala dermatitidis]
MEALVALGLVSNIVQLVDASWTLFEAYRQFRDRGTTTELEATNFKSQQITGCIIELKNSLANAANGSSLPHSDVNLITLGTDCAGVAEQLRKELVDFEIPPGSGGWTAFKTSVRLKEKWSRIKQLKYKLDQYVSVLDSIVLVNMSRNVRNIDKHIIDRLSQSEQVIVERLVNGNTSIGAMVKSLHEETRKHITKALAVTAGHIERKVDQLRDDQNQREEFKNFLKSLHFEEIHLRQNNIEPAHKATFEWILRENVDHVKRWSSFLEWTRNDSPIYWVLGKPGSGKSTLMNFLVQDPRTKAALTPASSNLPPLFLTFFFWEAGVDLQKNEIGLLRSLIWHILTLLESAASLQIWEDVVRPHMTLINPGAWTKKQLLPLLRLVITKLPNRICLFLDGLDEFPGLQDQFEPLEDVLDVFREQCGVKICISSRPSTALEPLYGDEDCPKLHLQYLTRDDIERYVQDNLTRHPRIAVLSGSSSGASSARLVKEVADRAEGVFLWVRLAIHSLLRGLRNDDDHEALFRRLEEVPKEIFDVYTHLWKRMPDYDLYAKEIALYLHLAQHDDGLSLVEYAITSDEKLQDEYLDASMPLNLEQWGRNIDPKRSQKRLVACCSGFLEVRDREPYVGKGFGIRGSWQWDLEKSVIGQYPTTVDRLLDLRWSHQTLRVSFMHRTAKEYLKTPSGQQLLNARPMSEKELAELRFRCDLVWALCLVRIPTPEDARYICRRFFKSRPDCDSERHDRFRTLLSLEKTCDRLVALGFAERFEDMLWPTLVGDIDYVKAFLELDCLEYTRHKLETSGLKHDSDYLTDLLRFAVNHDAAYSLCKMQSFLIGLGADVNSMLTSKRYTDCKPFTIWQKILGRYKFVSPEVLDLLDVCLEAGANLCINSPVYFACCGGSGNRIYTASNPDSWKRPHLVDFILIGADALQVLTAFGCYKALQTIQCVEARTRRGSLRHVVLCCQPNWRVVPARFCERLINVGLSERRIEEAELSRAFSRPDTECFENGRDALHAAGWNDEEIKDYGLLLEKQLAAAAKAQKRRQKAEQRSRTRSDKTSATIPS